MNPSRNFLPGAGFDVFIDLSRSALGAKAAAAHVERLRRDAGLGPEICHVTLALPKAALARRRDGLGGGNDTAEQALASALAAAAGSCRCLAVIQGVWQPGCEAIAALVALAETDPMIGSLQPRFALPDSDQVFPLPGEAQKAERLPRAALPFMPEIIVTPELPAALLVLTSQAVISAVEYDPITSNGELGTLLISLRRRGFRNLVHNRVVVPFPLDPEHAYPVRSNKDKNNLADQEETARARHWLDKLPERALESLLANAFASDMRGRLLLDCRAMEPLHNRSARAILGFLEGFDELRPAGTEITLLVSAEAARFHKLHGRFPAFRLQIDRPDGCFLIAVTLAAPWSKQAIAELHAHALILVFNMLDAIGWDSVYSVPEDIAETWRLMTLFADGLLFNSNFTRDRFTFRFPPDPSTKLAVTYHSFSSKEVMGSLTPLPPPFVEPYLLVVGDAYDRKDMKSSLSLLVDAFPFTKIIALDAGDHTSAQVGVLKSDDRDESKAQAFFAHAAAIIFPSYHNDFGCRVVQSLAYGRTVIMRRSQLWEEVASLREWPGAMVPFDDEMSLVEAVGRALHGLRPCRLQTGSALGLGTEPLRWRDCARSVLDFVNDLIFACDGNHWLTREAVLRQMVSIKDQR